LKDVTISFDQRCRVLVGINESGKSNILKALSLLDPDCKVQSGDLRDFSPDESTDQSAFVRFVFGVDKDERIECLESVAEKLLSSNANVPIVRIGERNLTLAQFVDSHSEVLYQADLRTGKKNPLSWKLPDGYSIVEGWYEPIPNVPADAHVLLESGETRLLSELEGIHRQYLGESEFISAVDESHLRPLTMDSLEEVVASHLRGLVEEGKPDCLYWTYSDSQLLPGQISLDGFSANPAICEPLRQMFALAGFDSATQAITEAKARPNGIRNLLNRVGEKATAHMRGVWKDYRGIKIELAQNGPHIDACVKDQHNLYNFDRRSDGFKRFISFLLLVSAKVRNAELVNTLYLHDEPDIGLHPSGARYLRDELIRIAEQNYVVFSTHSIFMIDRENVQRHFIVTKKDEITSVAQADASNITDEEVLFNALGYSLFESLRAINIIFEGWRDKELFRRALSGSTPRIKKLKKSFEKFGLCHAKGVKDVGRITPLLELAGRAWLVVSDADKPAVEHQNLYDGDGPWFRYDQLLDGTTAVTGEDFIKADAFKNATHEIEREFPALAGFDITSLANGRPKVGILRQWMANGGLNGDQIRAALDRIKGAVFNNLRPGMVEDSYLDLCEQLLNRLTELGPKKS
jgi:energy-coupling factor transporter ATP-binding protein EcfA2